MNKWYGINVSQGGFCSNETFRYWKRFTAFHKRKFLNISEGLFIYPLNVEWVDKGNVLFQQVKWYMQVYTFICSSCCTFVTEWMSQSTQFSRMYWVTTKILDLRWKLQKTTFIFEVEKTISTCYVSSNPNLIIISVFYRGETKFYFGLFHWEYEILWRGSWFLSTSLSKDYVFWILNTFYLICVVRHTLI